MGFASDAQRALRDLQARLTEQGSVLQTDNDRAAYEDPESVYEAITMDQLRELQQVYRPFIELQREQAFNPEHVTKIQNDLIGAVDEGIVRGAERAVATTAQAYSATPSALTARQQQSINRRSALQLAQARGRGRQSALQQAQDLRQQTIA